MKRASTISRIIASVIDIYLTIFIVLILIFLLLKWFEDDFVISIFLTLFLISVGMITVLFKDVVDGRSVGKRIFNLGVRELNGSVPSTGKLINRNFSSLFWPKDLYNLLFSNDKRKQGDIRNGTEVYQLENTKSMTKIVMKIVISISVIIVFLVFGIITMIKQDASYKEAIIYIKNNKEIQDKVGSNVDIGFFPSGSISRTNGYGEASFNIKVSGDKNNSLSVYIILVKEPNEKWKVKEINY
ncbi:cytochrome c oxidase assembly factor Coa1 family protein [Cohnella faecalis]|nr:cytochrome c oxidase assembly factor Coa1 family protein [Cohnella faecalis]